jgi:hypothetical protein
VEGFWCVKPEGARVVPPVVIVHLSDIHFTADGENVAARRKVIRGELMDDLAIMRKEIGDATAVLVTGDIAQAAEPDQYVLAAEWFDEVAAAIGTDRAQILAVPGNHDVHWGSIGRSGHDARTALRTCDLGEITGCLDEMLKDPARPLQAPLDNYNVLAQGFGCPVQAQGRAWERDLPLSHGYRLAIRGVTTVFNSDWDDKEKPSTLVVGETQLMMRPEPGRVRLVMSHHGPDGCRDNVAIRDRMRNRTAVWMCGHLHDQRPNVVNGCLEVTGAAVHPEESKGYLPSYNWLRIDVDNDHNEPTVQVELWQRERRPEWNGFGPVTDVSGHTPHRWSLPMPCPPPTPAAVVAEPAVGKSVPARASAQADTSAAATSLVDTPDEVRGALTNDDGGVPDDRRVGRALLDLPLTARMAVLLSCGLLDDEDIYRDPATMIDIAIQRAISQDSLPALEAAISATRR